VGRPGLDSGTLGGDKYRPSLSIDLHLSWSEVPDIPDMSTNVPLILLHRLSTWLSRQELEVVADA